MSIEKIKALANLLQLDCQEKESGITQFWTKNGYSFIELKHIYTYIQATHDVIDDIDFINKNEYCISLKFIFRSFHANGDRTDLNTISSIIVGIYLRVLLKTSFHFIEIEHPVIEEELYGIELIPSQPFSCTVDLENNLHIKFLEELITDFNILNNLFFTIAECSTEIKDEFSVSNQELEKWVQLISGKKKMKMYSLYNARTNPKWFFYKDSKVSIIKSQYLVNSLCTILKEYNVKVIDGINGKLFIDNNLNNIVHYKEYNRAKGIIKRIEKQTGQLKLIALDNIAILVGRENIVLFKNDGSLKSFIEEKELIRKRHSKEIKILFDEDDITFEINSQQDADLFENLILELLKMESHIFWARKVSPTNQPDNGRDIICRFNSMHNNERFKDGEQQVAYKDMIVQCKTRFNNSKKQSIGKADVDVADTIFEYKPAGYMVVTNTQITTRLTEYLEEIATRENMNIDWWNKEDIVERVTRHPELMNKYSDILSRKRQY